MRVFAILLLIGTSVLAQSGGIGSLQDPRSAGTQTAGAGVIEPWLAVNGNYQTNIDQPAGATSHLYRSVSLAGGLSMAKSFRRTELIFGYAGTGNDYLGQGYAVRSGWHSSNVVSLSLSSRVTHRVTLDFSEMGGAGNGGFGSAAAGMQPGGLGMLGTLGVASGYLFGGVQGLGGLTAGLNPLQNGLVDADYYDQMAYFSSTSAGVGFLLSDRSMFNVSGTASFVRRSGRSFSDANMIGSNAVFSTQLSHRFTTFFGYSYSKIDFVQSSGSTNIQSGFAGLNFALSPHDQISLSFSEGHMGSQFVTTIALPPDVAALLGVSSTTTVSNNSRLFTGGRLDYNHAFQRGGFDLECNSTVTPGNDLLLLTRAEGCTVSLSRSLVPRVSVVGIGGLRRLTGLAQSGGRYDVFSGGVVFSYRLFAGVSLTTGANYMASEIHPSRSSITGVSASAGLRWAPSNGARFF